MVAISEVAKLATLVLLKIKIFSTKGYDIIFAHLTNRILPRQSNYFVDVVM